MLIMVPFVTLSERKKTRGLEGRGRGRGREREILQHIPMEMNFLGTDFIQDQYAIEPNSQGVNTSFHNLLV